MAGQRKSKTVGHIDCPICYSVADVREGGTGRLFISCPSCGPINVGGRVESPNYRQFIDDKMKPIVPEKSPEPDSGESIPAPAASPEPVPEPSGMKYDDWGFPIEASQ